MMRFISMKFHGNVLTKNCHCQNLKGNNSKNLQTRVTVLVVCTPFYNSLYIYEVYENPFNCFKVIEGTKINIV